MRQLLRHYDSVFRANGNTFAAADTFLRNDGSQVVFKADRLMLAGFYALGAANTADRANLHRLSAFVFVLATNFCHFANRQNRDNVLRANFSASAAAGAFLRVYDRKAVNHFDCIEFANSYAIAIAKAAILASAGAAIVAGSSRAGGHAMVLKLGFAVVVGALAHNHGMVRGRRTSLYTHNSCNSVGSFLAARHAFVNRCAIFDDSLGIVCAACIAAGAAVCCRQFCRNKANALVFFYCHEFSSDNKNRSAGDTDDGNNRNC